MNHIFTSVRIYNNGDRVIQGVAIDHIIEHIRYNIMARRGCALIVDGIILNKGYLAQERVNKIANEIGYLRVEQSPLPYH